MFFFHSSRAQKKKLRSEIQEKTEKKKLQRQEKETRKKRCGEADDIFECKQKSQQNEK